MSGRRAISSCHARGRGDNGCGISQRHHHGVNLLSHDGLHLAVAEELTQVESSSALVKSAV